MHKHYEYDKLSAIITANLFGATSGTNSNFKATTGTVGLNFICNNIMSNLF